MKINTSFAQDILKKARSKGIDQVEVYILEGRSRAVEVKDQEIEGIEDADLSGYGIRIIHGDRLGFAYSTIGEDYESVLARAIEFSRFVAPDEYLTIPEPSVFSQSLEIFDPVIENISSELLVSTVMELEKSALSFDKRIKKTRKASLSVTTLRTSIVNSYGINVSYSSTSAISQIMVVAEDKGESQSTWEFEASRFFGDLSVKELGQRAAKKAVSLLGSRKLSSRKAALLFDQSVASEFLGFLSSSFQADSIIKGKSMLQDKLGRKVFSSIIDIVDNGLIPRRLGTRPVDGEGVASRITPLIKEGILEGYLHNTYTAKRLSSVSTGNASRKGYLDPPSVGISNLFIAPSEKARPLSFSQLINAESEMLYVLDVMGMHTGNPVTGDFSVGVSGLWIVKGEPAFAVKETMIAGNVIDLFDKVIAVGDDLKFYGSTGSPHILFRDIDISG
ncbi:MAG: TldD/PmbA family protein [Thermodesulfovibrionales bacterium]|nr:TldD/PmbA family protein [Thermodesulfovibrionales bacterium]